MSTKVSISLDDKATKSTVNQKWLGPNLGECEAAFVAAFVPATAEESVRVECAWCGCFLGGDPNGTIISHGICSSCLQEQLAQVEAARDEAIPFDGRPGCAPETNAEWQEYGVMR